MRTAHIHLEDWAWTALEAAANKDGVGVADLILSAIQEKYLQAADQRVEAFRTWQPPWRDREDIGDSVAYVSQLRQDSRLDRFYPE